MKILYHHRTQGRGAEGNHITSIVGALRSLGHEVDVLSPPGVDPFSAASTVPVDKARTSTRGWASAWKFVSLHLPNWIFEIAEILYNVPAYFRLRRQLRRGSYDLVYERYAFFLVAGALAARHSGCRFLLEANETSGIPDRARRQSFTGLCAWFERQLIRRCDVVHAVSSYLGKRVLSNGLDSARLAVVPNGFDTGRIRISRHRERVRESLGLTGRTVIGFAGWFDRWDRLDLLLECFEQVQRSRGNLKLCLIGAGPALETLKSRLEASPFRQDIVLTGAVARGEVYDYLQCLDIGVLPHSNDFGSPIVMFEMMGLGIPLIAPKLSPIEDVHVSDATALLFRPLDTASLRLAMEALSDNADLRIRQAGHARQMLQEHYTWASVATRIMEVLESLPAS